MRIIVTGISSYLAKTLFPLLDADASIKEIRGLDLKEPGFRSKKFTFKRCDVRDLAISGHMEGFDAIVHLAYIVMPIRDEALADDINVNGSKNVFRAAAEARLCKIVHLSSIAAYGSWPDNPEIITEDQPVRGMPSFYYSRSKAQVEKFLDDFEKDHPGIVITRLRPCIFVGPEINNVMKDVAGAKLMLRLGGHSNLLQLAWDDDVARAVHLSLKGDFRGAFNLSGEGTLTPEEMARMMDVRTMSLPYSVAYWSSKMLWALNIGFLSPGWIECMRYPIIVSTEKARKIMKWKPSYDTRGAFRRLLETLPEA